MTIYFVVSYRIVVIGKVNWCVVVFGRETAGWLDVPVVQYFGLTGGVDVVSNVDASSYRESYVDNVGAGLQLVLVAWSRRIEQVG